MCLYLPRLVAGSDEAEAKRDAPLTAGSEGRTVLVVDDEPTVRMLVVEVLEELGHRPLEAVDGASGLKLLESDERFDLLVTDVGLPGAINGRQLADAARVRRPELGILFITGYAENAVLGGGQVGPGMQVLTKPFTIEALSVRLKRPMSDD